MRIKKKNTMRSPEDKERIVLESFREGNNVTSKKYHICLSVLKRWRNKYRKDGIDGLISQTGKKSHEFNRTVGLERKKNKTREEELQLKVMKLEIEVARLKKGYQVKGVGSKKEYVTIKDLNTKS